MRLLDGPFGKVSDMMQRLRVCKKRHVPNNKSPDKQRVLQSRRSHEYIVTWAGREIGLTGPSVDQLGRALLKAGVETGVGRARGKEGGGRHAS